MQVTIQTVKDKQVFTMDDSPDFLKSCDRCIQKGSPIKITVDNEIYLINPANIVWIECINDKGD